MPSVSRLAISHAGIACAVQYRYKHIDNRIPRKHERATIARDFIAGIYYINKKQTT